MRDPGKVNPKKKPGGVWAEKGNRRGVTRGGVVGLSKATESQNHPGMYVRSCGQGEHGPKWFLGPKKTRGRHGGGGL